MAMRETFGSDVHGEEGSAQKSAWSNRAESAPMEPSQGGSTLHDRSADDCASKNDEVAIAVMGPTGSGKTSFINIVSGSNLRIGRTLQSCTSTVQIAPAFQLDGRWVTLIDTPGFDDTSKSDTDILTLIAAFLAKTYEAGKKLAGIIYMHRISDIRMGGISTRNFKMFRQLCGESSLKNVVIVTTMWGEVGLEVGEAREAELASDDRFFKPVLDKGALMLRHENDTASAQAILHYLTRNQPRALRIQRELVDQGKDISQTAAGVELNRELAEQIRRHREEMAVLQKEMKEAIRAKDEETRQELEIETKKLQAEMSRVQEDSQKLASDYNTQKAELEKRMEAAKRDAECAEENHRRQIQELDERLRQSATATNSEKDDIRRQLSEVQQRYEEARRLSQWGPRRGFFGNVGRALDMAFKLI
ncbi:P-loop containing nucleoside triphosphate hydrolase protein [Mycena belliarum]|uniref:P-loop containing nucleoside triphosphate hydrolase protein n=1 Tax=Mycena belliarum TaxID=1033014 RepID=A0AAD6UF45_9AGAR|nr:P-loop containing nucleoside triphosphate hydrolase protein [Mycena belliae]